MGYKSRGNWAIGFCLKQCSNKHILCEECVKFSHFVPGVPPASEFLPSIDDSLNTPENKAYREARNLREQIAPGLCTVNETRIPSDRNVHKMIHSEFKLKKKIERFKETMKSIKADPRDWNVDKLRRK